MCCFELGRVRIVCVISRATTTSTIPLLLLTSLNKGEHFELWKVNNDNNNNRGLHYILFIKQNLKYKKKWNGGEWEDQIDTYQQVIRIFYPLVLSLLTFCTQGAKLKFDNYGQYLWAFFILLLGVEGVKRGKREEGKGHLWPKQKLASFFLFFYYCVVMELGS